MKNLFKSMKCVAFAALSVGFTLGASAATPIEYLEPVYKTSGDPKSGIDHWVTKSVSDYTVVTSAAGRATWDAGWYVVSNDVTLSRGAAVSGDARLILADGATLSVTLSLDNTDNYLAFIGVSGAGNSFTVYGQTAGTGTLSITNPEDFDIYGAGIGGGEDEAGSNITINGGVVSVAFTPPSKPSDGGWCQGAGIGGGENGDGSYITINGGDVTVSCGERTYGSAGIGGGENGDGSYITINGGTVNVTGGYYGGAGIGGGANAAGMYITINGGTVTATGGSDGAGNDGSGIGGGYGGAGSNIFVADGVLLKADNNDPPTTVIEHASITTDVADSLYDKRYATVEAAPKPVGIDYLAPVYVTDGDPASGIDHWVTNTVSDFSVVTSATRAVTWGTDGATNWYVVTNANVQIDGGVICVGHVNLILCEGAKLVVTNVANMTAGIRTDAYGSFTVYGQPDGAGALSVYGGMCGAGIGGQLPPNNLGKNITINGGTVTAVGGSSASGIGGGMGGNGSDIAINGGTVMAVGGVRGAGIGGGSQQSGSNITINGGIVSAISTTEVSWGYVVGGSGIGGGSQGNGSGITINGGTVKAVGSAGASGIGGGTYGVGQQIAIGAVKVFVSGMALRSDGTNFYSHVIGNGGRCSGTAEGNVISDKAEIFFSLTPFYDADGKQWINEPMPMPEDFSGFVILTPETLTTNRVLVGGVANWTASTTFALTNGVTGATDSIKVNDAAGTHFAGADLTLPHANKTLTLTKQAAVASVTIGGVTTSYASIADAWAAAKIGKTNNPAILKLLTSVATEATLVTELTTVLTLDLDGKTLSAGEGCTGSIIMGLGDSQNSQFSTMTIQNGTITGSKDSAIYSSTGFELTLDHVVMTGNVGTNGAALHGDARSKFLIKDCVFTNNTAIADGGAIWLRKGQIDFKCLLIRTLVTDNRAENLGGGVFFQGAACLAAGTKVRLADGTETAIENVNEGDVVATFDHEGGTNAFARVYLAYKSGTKSVPFTLEFDAARPESAPYQLSIVGGHDLLEQGSRKYVTITESNVGQYIGAKFYGEDGAWHTLTSVTMGAEAVTYYSLYTAQHQNVYANGMLTVCDDVDYLLNIYELDEALKADATQLAADIAQYGLVTFEEAQTHGMSRAWYDEAGVKYLNVAVGKQLVSREYLEALFASTGQGVVSASAGSAAPRMTMSAMPKLSSLSADPLDEVEVSYLTLGEGTIITNNVAGDPASQNNIYLAFGSNDDMPYIALAKNHSGICAGVSRENGTGQFSVSNSVSEADVALFTSDKPEYVVRFDESGKYLKLTYSGVQVGDDAWAQIEDGLCTVRGTGDMWNTNSWPSASNPLAAYKAAITNVVVSSGVTSVGSHFFENMWYVMDVSLGADVQTIAEDAFHKCYSLTNVTSAAESAVTVGAGAFMRCNSLVAMSFAANPTLDPQGFKIQAAIRMEGDTPIIYSIPSIVIGGKSPTILGKIKLDDPEWTDLSLCTPKQKKQYHFFKLQITEAE